MTEPENDAPAPDSSKLSRQGFLARTAAAAAALGLGGLAAATAAPAAEPAQRGGARSVAGMNVVMFITDQERAIQHFPIGWAQENLPGFTELQKNGLTFNNAFTNACMCSPARSTLMTGYFPAQHGVKYTLEPELDGSAQWPQHSLSTSLANIATVMSAAGYHVIYKGKWHCSKPAGATWTQADLEAYGWNRWNPDDAGANQDIDEMGGGSAQNDARFMGAQTTDYTDGNEGILQFINSEAAQQAPFFLICSLVNPHDVLAYPKQFSKAGYSDIWLEGDIGLPATHGEDLSTKPRAQSWVIRLAAGGLGVLGTRKKKLNYLNFYGNLMKWSDEYLVNVMAALKQQNLFDNTIIIRTSDHGEMGLAHGGMRQKIFNFYEETLRVPMIWSNPTLYSRAYQTDALVSHVDFLPTIASLFNAPESARADWQGVDYSSIVLDPSAAPVQTEIVFTYDDYQCGQVNGPYVPPPQHIVSIRGRRWKLAEYYDANNVVPSEYELYDLRNDPFETTNIAHPSYKRSKAQKAQLAKMKARLETAKANRLQPLIG